MSYGDHVYLGQREHYEHSHLFCIFMQITIEIETVLNEVIRQTASLCTGCMRKQYSCFKCSFCCWMGDFNRRSCPCAHLFSVSITEVMSPIEREFLSVSRHDVNGHDQPQVASQKQMGQRKAKYHGSKSCSRLSCIRRAQKKTWTTPTHYLSSPCK